MSSIPPVRLLDRTCVASLIGLDECMNAVESAFASHERGRTLAPDLAHVDAVDGEFHIKCGGLRDPRPYFACKVNGSFFQNTARSDLPNILGLIILSDASNGRPLAILESGLITRLRTAAATAIAAKYLARPESESVTICGAGLQGAAQLRALTRVLPIRHAFIWSRSATRAHQLAAEAAAELGIVVEPVSDLGLATRNSDVIVTCTPSKDWFLGRAHVRGGTFIAAVGADAPGKQELEPELVAKSTVYCDLVEQCLRVGELQHAFARGLITREHAGGTLGGLIVGNAPGRRDEEEITLFDSTGTALQDVAASALVYERAEAANLGTMISFWP
ncbi:MAG: ornithine cyclodeaminase family protein [Gammaproteobacteria bacterium]